jgi:uncharacterized membrane protein YhaH (DUF805 family)
MEIVLQTLKTKYLAFDGRAGRKEYWMFVLAYFLAAVVAVVLDDILLHHARVLQLLLGLALFCPSLALGFRRLHDIDQTAWRMLIGRIPIVGAIVLLVFACLPGTPGPNRYGPDPRNGDPALGLAGA